ncbi:MAG: hypothetical protein IJ165_04210, partial [Proteobacteria bacterium]|nr:hypothetical protein [Pseudomonadota bacterium]
MIKLGEIISSIKRNPKARDIRNYCFQLLGDINSYEDEYEVINAYTGKQKNRKNGERHPVLFRNFAKAFKNEDFEMLTYYLTECISANTEYAIREISASQAKSIGMLGEALENQFDKLNQNLERIINILDPVRVKPAETQSSPLSDDQPNLGPAEIIRAQPWTPASAILKAASQASSDTPSSETTEATTSQTNSVDQENYSQIFTVHNDFLSVPKENTKTEDDEEYDDEEAYEDKEYEGDEDDDDEDEDDDDDAEDDDEDEDEDDDDEDDDD